MIIDPTSNNAIINITNTKYNQLVATAKNNLKYLSEVQCINFRIANRACQAIDTPITMHLRAISRVKLAHNNKITTADAYLAKRSCGYDADIIK